MRLGRPRKSSQQLKAAGAKRSVYERRAAEERAAADPATVQAIQKFVRALKHEREEFRAHQLDGITVVACDQPPAIFDEMKLFCERMLATNKYPRSRRLCARFLKDLENGARRGVYFDKLACENTQIWLDTFGVEGSEHLDSERFVLANLVSWKKSDGSYRFHKRWSELSIRHGKVFRDGVKMLDRL